MTSARPAMILSGLAVLLAVVVAEIDHVLFSARLFAFAASWPAALFQGIMVGVSSAGFSMLLFAPERRQRRRDVRLQVETQVQSSLEREAHHAVANPAHASVSPHSQATPGLSAQATPGLSAQAPAMRVPPAAPAWMNGQHPSVPVRDHPAPTTRISAPQPPHVKNVDGQQDADLARISLLKERADRLKVQFALGKISPTGYKEMQRRIEADLAQAELRLAEDQYVS